MISQKTNLNEYYKSLRNNVITFLGHNRLPIVGSTDITKWDEDKEFYSKYTNWRFNREFKVFKVM